MRTVGLLIAAGLAASGGVATMAGAESTADRPQSGPAAYIAPMSHLDLTFMGTVEECLSRGGKIFSGALDLLGKQPDFRYLIEYVMFLEAYRSAHPKQAAQIDDHIRAGRIELGAEWSGIYITQEDEEDIIRNVLFAKRYARERYGLELATLQLTDIPAAIPQLPQLCAGLGISNLVMTRCAPPDTLFWFEASGGDRVLTWSSKGYNQAFTYGAHASVTSMKERGLAVALERAAEAGIPPLFYYGSDQWLPPPALAPSVAEWNAGATGARQLKITTPTDYFRAVRASGVAARAPTLRGELPSTWPYLEPAHAHISRWDSVATRALDAAERLSALAWLNVGLPYPGDELEQIWRSLLLARDHNYGGQGAGGGHPRKFLERRAVQHRSQVLSQRAMAAIAETVEVPRESIPIVVFNTLNWKRSGPVEAHVSAYAVADVTRRDIIPRGSAMVLRDASGQPVPFQITADRRDTLGEMDLAFIAKDVPALGYSTYILEPMVAAEAAAIEAGFATGRPRVVRRVWFESDPAEVVLENNKVAVAIDGATGLARIRSRGAVVVEGLGLMGREELPEVCRRPPLGLSLDDPEREKIHAFQPAGREIVCEFKEGPVLASVSVRGTVMETPAEIQYSIGRDLGWVDVTIRLDWDLRHFGRIELAYQVPLKGAQAEYGLPFGAGGFGQDRLMPGSGPIAGDEGSRTSWERTREICRWLNVGNDDRGVAMATAHRWTRADETDTGIAVRCCIVRGGRMRSLEPLMDGPDSRTGLVFSFRLQPHGGSWQAARIPRVGWESVQPLLSYTVNDTWSPKSLPRAQSLATVSTSGGKGDALLTCLKRAEGGDGVIARWYEGAGEPCQVRVAIPPTSRKFSPVDLQERPATGEGAKAIDAERPIDVPAWRIVTILAR